MKSLSLLMTFFIIVSTNLSARENPFEPTQTYEAEVARLIEIDEDYPYEFQEKEDQEAYKNELKKTDEKIKATKEEMHTQTSKPVMEEKKPAKPVVKKAAPAMQITKEKPTEEKKSVVKEKMAETVTPAPKEEPAKKMTQAKEDIKEDMVGTLPVDTTKSITLEKAMQELNKVIVEVPKRTDVELHENVDILPFVNLDYTNDKIEINSKYDVFRKFTIDKSNKIVLDYHAKTFFLTKNKILDTDYFEKVVIGNHLKDKYFRIVIVLKNKPNKYKVTYADNLVTIVFDKDMI